MTIKNDQYTGFTDWSDGDVLYAADLNDTLDAIIQTTKILKRGKTNITGVSGASTDVADITVPALADGDMVIIDLFVKANSGVGVHVGLDNTTGTDPTIKESTDGSMWTRFILMIDPNNGSQCAYVLQHVEEDNSTASAHALSAEFDFSAEEHIFITGYNSAEDKTSPCSYNARLIQYPT